MNYYDWWLTSYYQRFDGKSKFRQDGSYISKEIDHIKEDWRERKGFAKDQSKHRTWCKCRRYHKQLGNRKNRRNTNQLIYHGRYDEIYYNQDMYVSMWDVC